MPRTMGLLLEVAAPEVEAWRVPVKLSDIAGRMTGRTRIRH